MNTVRSPKATYVAAFLLGVLIALLIAAPGHSAELFRLDRVAIVRFTETENGELRRQQAVLHLDGRILTGAATQLARPANFRPEILGRNLISTAAWLSYHALGHGALANFMPLDGGVKYFVGDEPFMAVAPNPDAATAGGRVVNISTRTRLATGSDIAIVGFVIDGQPRTVLVRAVGPTLSRFGLGAWLADPFVSIKRSNGQTAYSNDNWPGASEAAAIREASRQVGAFPLDEDSADAARLVVLEPGAYTVHAQAVAANASGGDVLIEVYSVPDSIVELPGANP